MSQYKDATEIPGFGPELILYKRADLASNAWWFRANIQGRRGYIRRSTRETELPVAVKVATKAYGTLVARQEMGLELGKRKVSELAKRWLNALKDPEQNTGPKKTSQRLKYIDSTWHRYMEGYFGPQTATNLDARFVAAYWHYRRRVNKGDEVQRRKIANESRLKAKSKSSHNIVEEPSYATLRAEASIINQFLRWCLDEKHIGIPLKISATSAFTQSEVRLAADNRRPTFDEKEWDLLTKNLANYAKNKGKTAGIRANEWHKYRRIMFRYYILFLRGTGLRVGEVRNLTWRKISTPYESSINEKVLKVVVDAETSKVRRARTAIGFSERAAQEMDEWRNQSRHSGVDDLVFYNLDSNGVQVPVDFSVTWKSFLQKIDLWTNDKGRTRPLYSLRHLYGTQRLRRDTDIYRLALLMGTGVKQIEKHYSHIASETLVAEATKGATKQSREQARDIRDAAELIRLYRQGSISPEQVADRIRQIGDTMGKM
jgi:integrase